MRNPQVDQLPTEEPLYLGVLYDASGSMEVYAEKVLKYQPELLKALRKTHKCRRKCLMMYQGIFAKETSRLHTFTQVAEDGRDSLVTFTPSVYKPGGATSLHRAIIEMLSDLEDAVAKSRRAGMYSSCSIAVITDGANTEEPKDASVVRAKMQQIRDQDINIFCSLVIGIPGPQLNLGNVEQIRKDLGFSEAALADGTDDRAIRRVFLLPSQPNMGV